MVVPLLAGPAPLPVDVAPFAPRIFHRQAVPPLGQMCRNLAPAVGAVNDLQYGIPRVLRRGLWIGGNHSDHVSLGSAALGTNEGPAFCAHVIPRCSACEPIDRRAIEFYDGK